MRVITSKNPISTIVGVSPDGQVTTFTPQPGESWGGMGMSASDVLENNLSGYLLVAEGDYILMHQLERLLQAQPHLNELKDGLLSASDALCRAELELVKIRDRVRGALHGSAAPD